MGKPPCQIKFDIFYKTKNKKVSNTAFIDQPVKTSDFYILVNEMFVSSIKHLKTGRRKGSAVVNNAKKNLVINIENLVKEKINKLWSEFGDEEFCRFSPNSIAEVPDDGLIFIGINPSMIEKVRLKLIEKNDINCEFHKLTYDENKEYRYFKKFFDVAKKTEMNWGHLDILYNRETNQKKVKGLLKTERGKDFLYKQCMITRTVLDKLIDEENPRIFVVTNSFARDLLGRYRKENEPIKPEHWIGYDFVWNNELGTYLYKNNPFFFSSMLTGQRALDKGSYERLVWQIKLVKNKLLAESTIYNNV